MPEVVYYETARGDEPVAAYVERLGRSGNKRDVAAILDLIVELEERGSALRMPDARIIDRDARIFSCGRARTGSPTPSMAVATCCSTRGGSKHSALIGERSPPPGGGLLTGGNVMARNARAHIEEIVTADPEIQEEYEALRLRREIIARLRALRERKRWTQQQLADAVGMPRSAIARLESAEHSPRIETLHAVARVLGYQVDVRFKRRRAPVA